MSQFLPEQAFLMLETARLLTTDQEFVLFRGEGDDGEAAHSYQRRSGEDLVGFDFGESNWFGECFARGDFYLRVFGIGDFDGNDESSR